MSVRMNQIRANKAKAKAKVASERNTIYSATLKRLNTHIDSTRTIGGLGKNTYSNFDIPKASGGDFQGRGGQQKRKTYYGAVEDSMWDHANNLQESMNNKGRYLSSLKVNSRLGMTSTAPVSLRASGRRRMQIKLGNGTATASGLVDPFKIT